MNTPDGQHEPEDLTVDWPSRQPGPVLPDDDRTMIAPQTPRAQGAQSAGPTLPPPPYSPTPPVYQSPTYQQPGPDPFAAQRPAPNPYAAQQPAATTPPWQTPPFPAAQPAPGTAWAGPPTGGGYPPAPPAGGYPPAASPAPAGGSGNGGGGRRWGLAVGAAAVVAAVAVGGAWWFVGRDDKPGNTTAASDSTTTSQTSTAPPTTTGSAQPTSSTPTTTTSSTPSGTISPQALPNLLLSADEVSTRMSSPGMVPGDLAKEPAAGVDVTPASCTGVFTPGHAVVYGGSGYTAFAAQTDNDPGGGIHKVIQMVASFPTDQAAQDFYAKQFAAWKACGGTSVSAASPGSSDTTTAQVGSVTEVQGVLQTIVLPTTSPSRICARNLAAKGNVIIDVRACAENPGSAAWSMVRDIGQKITGKR